MDNVNLNIEQPIKKKNKKGLIITLLILIILISCALGVYCFIFNKPKNIFLKNINNEYKQFSSLFNDIETFDIKTATSSMDFDLNINVNELFESELTEEQLQLIEEINALNFKLDSTVNLNKKLLALIVDAKYNENNLIDLGVYGKPNSIYVSLGDVYDKYIEMPFEEYETLFEQQTFNIKDVEYLTSKLKDAFLNSLDEKHFEKTSETISVNGEEIKATKIAYILTEERAYNILISILKEIKEDSRFLEILSSLSNMSVDEIKTGINDTIDEINNELKSADIEEKIELSMYTKGINNKAIKYSITSDDAEIIYTNYQDRIKLVFKDSEETYLTLTNIKNEDDSYKTEIVMSNIKVTVTSKEENDTFTADYKIVELETKTEIKGNLTLKMNEVKKHEEYNQDLKLSMSVGMTGIEIVGMEITIKGTTKYNTDVTIPDVSNSILYTNLTEEDTNTIMFNMLNNETLVNFIIKISELIGNSVEDSNKQAAENSAYAIIDAAKHEYLESMLNSTSSITTSGNVTDLKISGENITSGTWSLDTTTGTITLYDVKISGYTCNGYVGNMTCE